MQEQALRQRCPQLCQSMKTILRTKTKSLLSWKRAAWSLSLSYLNHLSYIYIGTSDILQFFERNAKVIAYIMLSKVKVSVDESVELGLVTVTNSRRCCWFVRLPAPHMTEDAMPFSNELPRINWAPFVICCPSTLGMKGRANSYALEFTYTAMPENGRTSAPAAV